MTVSAQSARRLAEPANVARVELRRGGPVLAGSYLYEGDLLVTGWHVHDVHQIEYAIGGVVEVETAAGHYLLPPQQAAWIPAGLQHQATMNPSVKTLAVMFDPAVIPEPVKRWFKLEQRLQWKTRVHDLHTYEVRVTDGTIEVQI